MKKQIIIVLALLLAFIKIEAQQISTLSLNDALEYAVKNRFDAQANTIDVALAGNAIRKSQNEWLPKISANGELLYNTKLQTMVFDQGNGNITEFQTGTKNQSTLSLELSQTIYKPGLTSNIKINKAEQFVQNEKLKEKENSIKMTVTETYLNVILKEQQLKLSHENTERFKAYFDIAKDRMRLGTILESDMLKTQTDYENAMITEKQSTQNYDLAVSALKFQLNLDKNETLVLSDSLSVLLNNSPTQILNVDVPEKPELKQLYFSQKENELRLKKANTMWLPTVSFVGNYTTQYQAPNFSYSQNLWFPYNYIGIKASLPISDLLKLRTNNKEFWLKSTQLNLQYNQKQSELVYEIDKCNTELHNTSENISSTMRTLTLSKELYNQQLATYKLGTITYSTLLDAEASVNTAEQNYIKSVYDYLIAFYNYKKVMCF
jgi:outer membrane protein